MSSSESTGGTGLLAVLAFATIFIVALESVFIAFASWWLMAAVVLTLMVVALCVVSAIVFVIDHDGMTLPKRAPAPAPEPERAPAPVGRPVLGH